MLFLKAVAEVSVVNAGDVRLGLPWKIPKNWSFWLISWGLVSAVPSIGALSLASYLLLLLGISRNIHGLRHDEVMCVKGKSKKELLCVWTKPRSVKVCRKDKQHKPGISN